MPTKDEKIAEFRRRYAALKSSGQTPRRLPDPSARPAPAVSDAAILFRDTVPGGWYWQGMVRKGETLRIALAHGPAAVSLLAWNQHETSERLNYADTVKVQWSAMLRKGRIILSDMGKVMLSMVEDSCCAHDALMGGSIPASRPDGSNARNTRDNFILAAAKLGLDARDIPPCITFFAPVRIDDDGRFRWDAEARRLGDYVDLRAEMDLLVAFSNCPHPLDPLGGDPSPPVDILRFAGPPVTENDLCRNATDEARRAFENNAMALA